ncbi:C-type lectin domain family 6 member A [Halictus rubicundus]|uniref:C-type lectin domain family 6 member A n=1 Tax=Halictus rubicundus TaxID=77578 RepID=UPI0040357951
MSQLFIFVTFLMVSLITNVTFCDRCFQINLRPLPYYQLIKTNFRSSHVILSRTTVRSVNECREFALAKKALAFNYGLESKRSEWHLNTRNKQRKGTIKVCQALQCPEVHNFTVLRKDKNYKYYSMYPSYIPSGSNFTLICIPKTGVFVISNNYLNYSQAQRSCQKINSTLAHIISEERTGGLAKYISENTPTFVGLSNRDHEKIWKNEFDEPFSCFKYRAWGEGEPSHSRGCVAIMKSPKSEYSSVWKVVPCDSLLHFICEVSPMHQSLRN